MFILSDQVPHHLRSNGRSRKGSANVTGERVAFYENALKVGEENRPLVKSGQIGPIFHLPKDLDFREIKRISLPKSYHDYESKMKQRSKSVVWTV